MRQNIARCLNGNGAQFSGTIPESRIDPMTWCVGQKPPCRHGTLVVTARAVAWTILDARRATLLRRFQVPTPRHANNRT